MVIYAQFVLNVTCITERPPRMFYFSAAAWLDHLCSFSSVFGLPLHPRLGHARRVGVFMHLAI